MGIRAKQLLTSTFSEVEVDRVFAAQSIDGDRLKNSGVTEAQIATTAFDSSLVGGGGTTIGLETNTDNFAPTFTGAGAWSFSADRLQVTGTPDSANDAANKAYVDNQITGLSWKQPVDLFSLLGERTVTQIDALTPATGDAVVATDAGTPTAGASDALAAGDVAEFNGTSWKKIIANVAGRVPNGVRAILSTGTALVAPFVDATDDGRIVESVDDPGTFNGTVSDFDDTGDAADGNAVIVQGAETNTIESVKENIGYVFDGAVPAGSWVQFTGAGQINAGAGLTKDGNTLDVGDVNRGIQVNADDLEIDGSEIASATGGLQENTTNSWQLDIKTHAGALGAAVTTDANGVNIDGDKVDITFTPVNYAPDATPAEADDVDDLAAHLKGIDTAIGTAGTTAQQEEVTTENITGTDTALTDTLDAVPVSNASVVLYLNGIQQVQGAGKDYTISGQTITWLASSGTAVDMDTTDVLVAVYES